MIDLGTVLPGSTLYLPFATFDGGTGASLTMTGLALGDIAIYKDGGTTQRASTAGFTLLDTDGIDFDAVTGIHGYSIDLADNTTAGFYAAGSRYFIVIASITVDAQPVNFVHATFRIGYPAAVLSTTIATLASQTSFTLTAGSADNDAYNGCVVVVHDVASAVQVALGYVLDYTGATKTITLAADPAIFTMAATDNIAILPRVDVGAIVGSLANATNLGSATAAYSATRGLSGTALPAAAADAAGGLPVSDAGGLDVDAQRADVAAILVDTGTTLDGRIPAALIGGRLDANVGALSGDATAADNAEAFFDGTGYAGTGNVIPTVTTVTGAVGSVTGAVGSVTGAVGSVTGAVGSVAADGIAAASIAAGALTSAKFAASAIDAAALAADAGTELAAAVLAAIIEGTVTVKQSLALSNAAAAGKLSGAATTSVALRNVADTLDRIAATVDADGNRSAVTRTFTDI